MNSTWMNESLHQHLASHFGKDTLQLVRELEKTARKLADYRNHLRFNLRCRNNKIFPKSLMLRLPDKGHRIDIYLQKFRYQVLSERIRQTNFTIENLQHKIEQIQNQLATRVTDEIQQRINNFIEHAQLSQHKKSKDRQKRKFDILSNTQQQKNSDRLTWRRQDSVNKDTDLTTEKDKWVKNLSDRELTQTETAVLSKGLNFSIAPTHMPTVEYITATESAIRNSKLEASKAEDLRLKVTAVLNSAKPPPSNLTKEESKALNALEKDKNIIFLPADKGRCTVILNTADYEEKINSLLEDTTTYEPLKRDPTSGYSKKVRDSLKKLKNDHIIDDKLYYRLISGETIPRIYGLPKIHKEGTPLRPIVSSIDSVTYNVARHVATILSPLVGNTQHHIVNSQDFAHKVKQVKVDSDETIVSYDVTSLFTCIPTDEAVTAVRRRLQQDTTLQDRTNLTADHICELLELCLNTTYFQFRGNFYRQKHGCAMGSPVSPIVANLYMEEVERKALESFTGVAPSHWFRYVDDTWVKIKIQELEAFTKHINSVNRHIKFTREDATGNRLAFLDCAVVIGEGGKLQVEVYRKPTHTDQYLLFDSHHPLNHKLSVIRTLQHRAREVPTSEEGKKKEEQHVRKALRTCGYPNWAFSKAKSRSNKKQTDTTLDTRRTSTVIPYVAGVSEKLKRIFNQYDISVQFKPSNTIRQRLVHPKDKIPRHKQSNVVYAVKCSEDCSDLYIGETKQPLHRRMYQHRRGNTSGPQSAVHLHQKETGHSFEDSDVRILDRESRWFERGVKEACYVTKENPSLNRGGGLRYNLPHIYKHLLKEQKHRNSHCRSHNNKQVSTETRGQ